MVSYTAVRCGCGEGSFGFEFLWFDWNLPSILFASSLLTVAPEMGWLDSNLKAPPGTNGSHWFSCRSCGGRVGSKGTDHHGSNDVIDQRSPWPSTAITIAQHRVVANSCIQNANRSSTDWYDSIWFDYIVLLYNIVLSCYTYTHIYSICPVGIHNFTCELDIFMHRCAILWELSPAAIDDWVLHLGYICVMNTHYITHKYICSHNACN